MSVATHRTGTEKSAHACESDRLNLPLSSLIHLVLFQIFSYFLPQNYLSKHVPSIASVEQPAYG